MLLEEGLELEDSPGAHLTQIQSHYFQRRAFCATSAETWPCIDLMSATSASMDLPKVSTVGSVGGSGPLAGVPG